MKQIAFILMITLALLITACGGTGQASVPQAAGAPAAASQGAPSQATPAPGGQSGQPREMPRAMTLAIGTLKLEGSANAVSGEQAQQLLTLWKAVRSLTNSETAAQKEIDSLFKQIESAMTAEQIAAIESMEITPESIAALGEELGFSVGSPQGTMDPGMQTTLQAARETAIAGGETLGQGGGFGGPPPGGGMGGGPGGMGGGPMGSDEGLSEEARATAIAQRGPRGARTGVPPALLEAIIELLEAKGQ